MFHVCAVRFDVKKNLIFFEFWVELNRAAGSNSYFHDMLRRVRKKITNMRFQGLLLETR
jgi:hypothetical protein